MQGEGREVGGSRSEIIGKGKQTGIKVGKGIEGNEGGRGREDEGRKNN